MSDVRERVLDGMAANGIDVVILGRQDNIAAVTDATMQWIAGTLPARAGCVLVASTRRVHVNTSWDAGVPPSIPFDDLYPLSWNPARVAELLRAISGLVEARRIGVDALSPPLQQLLAELVPGAELAPADWLLAEARRTKSPEEVAAITAACAVAWIGVETALDQGPAAAIEALARAGATRPTSGVCVDGDVIDVGVLVAGFEGGVGGRFVHGRRESSSPLPAACRPGASWSDLNQAATSPSWRVRGLGRGYEHPVLGPAVGHREHLTAGMVLSVADGDHREVVHVTDAEPMLLSSPPTARGGTS